MELRLLRYFLTVAREGSITNAANALHITQPTLSRQIHELEEELGQPLLVRGSRSVSLTGEGMLLRKRAEEILELVEKTEREVSLGDDVLTGEVSVGAGETVGVHFLTKAAQELRRRYPEVRFQIISGDGMEVCELLDKGLIDFGLVFDHVDRSKYNAMPVPWRDVWGVLVRKDHPLAEKEAVTPADLIHQPLLVSRQVLKGPLLPEWFGAGLDALNIAGTYTLAFNGSLMVEDGMGCALCLDRIINLGEDSPLCFRPLEPRREAGMHIIWKKYQVFSRAAEKYLELLEESGKE
ncbi:MAG TPA: LysR family transcriptional regulator [Candidatus Fournierella excrementavium]|nr:LysR family transcriptional regulator [Candidatus Fournierella excrementavium]